MRHETVILSRDDARRWSYVCCFERSTAMLLWVTYGIQALYESEMPFLWAATWQHIALQRFCPSGRMNKVDLQCSHSDQRSLRIICPWLQIAQLR